MVGIQRLWELSLEVQVNRQSHVGRVAVFAAKAGWRLDGPRRKRGL